MKAERVEGRKRLRRFEAGSDEPVFQLASTKLITHELRLSLRRVPCGGGGFLHHSLARFLHFVPSRKPC